MSLARLDIDTFAGMVALEYRKFQDMQRRTEIWKAFDQRTEAQQRPFRVGIRKLFGAQKAQIMGKLDRLRTEIEAQQERRYEPDMRKLYAIIKVSASDIAFDQAEMQEWRYRFSEFGQLMLPTVVEDAGNRAMGTVLVGVDFDVSNPRVVDYIDKKAWKFSFEVNETTQTMLRRELRAGLEAGEDIRKLGGRVGRVFDMAKGYRTKRIARTEVIGASNYGAMEAYRQSGVVEQKEWLATKDARVRDSHAAMDGERRKLDEPFSNGLMQPGDMAGAAAEIINCRCTILPVVEV